MKTVLLVLAFGYSISIYAKEWKSLRQYQKATHQTSLSPSDWFASDRRQNTLVWQHSNAFNLSNDRPQEYQTINQRRDFYVWIINEFHEKGHEVNWPYMANYISRKLRLLETFPHCIFTSKHFKNYILQGSEVVFVNAFSRLRALYISDQVLNGNEGLLWDENMLHDEQYKWVQSIYLEFDTKDLKKIKRIVGGKFIYALVVPKPIRFEGDLSNPEVRYRYALNIFRPYCINHMK